MKAAKVDALEALAKTKTAKTALQGAGKAGQLHAGPAVELNDFSCTVDVAVEPGTPRTLLDWSRAAKRPRAILSNVTGRILPGEMVLVLGEPGCGKTTLLRALAQQLAPSVRTTGSLSFDGVPIDDAAAARTLAYVEETDDNLPTLTVRETLELSHAFQGGKGPSPETVIKELGLEGCKETMVGNFMIRGISGGEKRRTTLGEMLVGPQSGWLLDEVTSGLDSATAANIFRYLKRRTVDDGQWVVAALLQPPPDVFDLFDRVMVLKDGKPLFFGPRDGLAAYMADVVGLPVPEGVSAPDWVQDVVAGAAAGAGDAEAGGAARKLPTLLVPQPESALAANSGAVRINSLCGRDRSDQMPWLEAARLLIWRQWVLLYRNKALFMGRVGQSVGNAVFVGLVFWQLGFDEFQSKFGLFFFMAMGMSMGCMIMVPVIVLQRAVLAKQQRARFFPLSAYLVGDLLSQVPLLMLETIGFVTGSYVLTGLTWSDNGIHYFVAMLVIWMSTLTLGEWFKISSALAPDAATALPVCGLTTVAFILQSGFVATKDAIPDGWIWLYHISPVGWAIRALGVNEFDSEDYTKRSEYLTLADGSTEAAGQVYLSAYGFDGFYFDYVATCMLVLIGECVIFVGLHYLALKLVRWDDGSQGTTAAAAVEEDEGPEVEMAVLGDDDKAHVEGGGVTFEFTDISYFVMAKKKKGEGKGMVELQLLDGVSGRCLPGTVTALMGASGAGKTTLLDVLAGRKTRGRILGSVTLNGQPKDDRSFAVMAAYVEQQDIHTLQATVHEAVAFSAKLRLPLAADHEAAVRDTLKVLELDRLGGRTVASLSGAQAKRLTIAVELVTNPSILFLDEPTTGLDARAAALVMKSVRRIADQGRTVCLTVHQPSAAIVSQFDELLLLQKGGRRAYAGRFDGVVPFMEALSGTNMPAAANPADFMLETLSVMPPDTEFPGSEPTAAAAGAHGDSLPVIDWARAGSGAGLQALMCRTARSYWRTRSYNLTRLASLLLFALIFGTTYSGDYDQTDTLISHCMMFFMFTLFAMWIPMIMVLPGTSVERAVMYREKPNRAYSSVAWVESFFLVELPYVALVALVASLLNLLVFFGGDEGDGDRYLWFLLFIFLDIYLGVSWGIMLVTVLPNELLAQLATVLTTTMFALFAGVLTPSSTLGVWKVFYWISPFHYLLEGMITTQFHGDTTPVKTLLGGEAPAGWLVENQLYEEFSYDNRFVDVAVVVAFILMARVTAHVATRRLNYQSR